MTEQRRKPRLTGSDRDELEAACQADPVLGGRCVPHLDKFFVGSAQISVELPASTPAGYASAMERILTEPMGKDLLFRVVDIWIDMGWGRSDGTTYATIEFGSVPGVPDN
jgi:hypothetical protein